MGGIIHPKPDTVRDSAAATGPAAPAGPQHATGGFEAQLKAALEVEVPAQLADRVLARPRR